MIFEVNEEKQINKKQYEEPALKSDVYQREKYCESWSNEEG